MITPSKIYEEVRASGRHIIIGGLKLFPPGGKNIISKNEAKINRWSLLEDTDARIEGIDNKSCLIEMRDHWNHALRNRYFLKSFKKDASWMYLGESDAADELFPIEFNVDNLEVGSYILKAIITGDTDEYQFIAEDSLLIELTP